MLRMQSKARTVQDYMNALPDDRRQALQAVREVFLKNIDKDIEEGMQYGMIGYYVPHRVFPPGYHCNPKEPLPYAGLASQKGHMSLYLGCVYGDTGLREWFQKAWAKAGKKLDMGAACVRFKKVDDLALDVLAEALRRVPSGAYVSHYEKTILTKNKRASAKAKGAPKAERTRKAAPGRRKAAR